MRMIMFMYDVKMNSLTNIHHSMAYIYIIRNSCRNRFQQKLQIKEIYVYEIDKM